VRSGKVVEGPLWHYARRAVLDVGSLRDRVGGAIATDGGDRAAAGAGRHSAAAGNVSNVTGLSEKQFSRSAIAMWRLFNHPTPR
jgi:hypothetical protein